MMNGRHIDTASAYRNEQAVGKALSDSGVPREEIFVTTKVFITEFGVDATRKACESSLRLLGTDYIDLYLVHWPVHETMMDAWETMQAMRDEGKLRSIGVSNFTVRRFEEFFLKHTDELPAVNQVEFHPFWFRKELLDYCHAKGIRLEGYSPLVRGQRLDDPVIRKIADACGKSPAQVLIRWQLQHDMVVIPKSSHPKRICENADVFDFEIAPDDMASLDGLNEDCSVLTWRPSKDWY